MHTMHVHVHVHVAMCPGCSVKTKGDSLAHSGRDMIQIS